MTGDGEEGMEDIETSGPGVSELESKPDDGNVTNITKIPCICCGTDNSKYKCPKCFLKYCSVNCCQLHKTNGTCPGKPSKTITAKLSNLKLTTSLQDTDDPLEKLKYIVKSPSLQEWIKKLDSCSIKEAPILYDAAMENPEFLEYAQLIAKIRSNDSEESECEL